MVVVWLYYTVNMNAEKEIEKEIESLQRLLDDKRDCNYIVVESKMQACIDCLKIVQKYNRLDAVENSCPN